MSVVNLKVTRVDSQGGQKASCDVGLRITCEEAWRLAALPARRLLVWCQRNDRLLLVS